MNCLLTKEIKAQMEKEAYSNVLYRLMLEEIMTLEELDQLKDEDFEEHMEFLEELQELDEEYMKSIIGEE